MRAFFLLLVFAFMADPAKGFSKTVGSAAFVASTNAGFDVKGEEAKVILSEFKKDKEGKISGNFTVNLKELKTGMDLRDTHMCDTLECGKFPKAIFKLNPLLPEGKQPISGILELHGEQKPFYGQATFKSSTSALVTGKLRLSDFGIKAPNYKLVRVEDVVEVQIEITSL